MQSKYLQVRFTCCIDQNQGMLTWNLHSETTGQKFSSIMIKSAPLKCVYQEDFHRVIVMPEDFSCSHSKCPAIPETKACTPAATTVPTAKCYSCLYHISRLCMIACMCMCVCVGVEPSLMPTLRCDEKQMFAQSR